MRILSEVNLTALRQTFQTILNRQAVLRTIVYVKDGQPVQQIWHGQPVPFTHNEPTRLSAPLGSIHYQAYLADCEAK